MAQRAYGVSRPTVQVMWL